MPIKIKYAYLSGQVWIYRRNYPSDVQQILGSQALKRTLKTTDPRIARQRSIEVNAHYEETVAAARTGKTEGTVKPYSWITDTQSAVEHLRVTLGALEAPDFSVRDQAAPSLADLSHRYLTQRSLELRPSGYKSVRYSVELFTSKYGHLKAKELGRDEGREFLGLLPSLSTLIGKDDRSARQSLEWLLEFSRGKPKIKARTQKRIWSQVNHFLNWVVYEGDLELNPFLTVRFERKIRKAPYAVLRDEEVSQLLNSHPRDISGLLRLCLLTGMRSGEAVGLLREDIISKSNLGRFVQVKPNYVRELKTEGSEREVPIHSALDDVLERLPKQGPLFPDLSVNLVTKRFAEVRSKLKLERPGLVFHSTRKWFITQCERTGAPEHFTASLVGHQSARSENQLTYSIYSAGISDEQKRSIVDQLRLPA